MQETDRQFVGIVGISFQLLQGKAYYITLCYKGLFTRREGYPSKQFTLALTNFLFFFLVMFTRQLHVGLPG